MRRANKQIVSHKHTKRGRFRCPTFKVLAGNLYNENRKTPTIQVSASIIIIVCSFHLQVSERFE